VGKQTKGAGLFKKHINAPTQKTRKSSADEHDDNFAEMKTKNAIKGIAPLIKKNF
jgi:hypothetical protein